MEELDLVDLFYMIKKRLWLIILLFLLGAGSAYLYSEYRMEPIYATHAKLMLGKPEGYESSEAINMAELQMNSRLIKTYAAIAKTEPILGEVKDALSFPTSVGYLKSVIGINLLNETEIIQVYVQGTSPERIAEIANTFSEVFTVKIAEMMKIDNVSILERAYVPYGPFSPNIKKNVVLGGGAGIAIALFLIFLFEMLDNTIKIPEDVSKLLGIPVLGVIPEHD
jgi:capsular polysaccharide biosynthesis protein